MKRKPLSKMTQDEWEKDERVVNRIMNFLMLVIVLAAASATTVAVLAATGCDDDPNDGPQPSGSWVSATGEAGPGP